VIGPLVGTPGNRAGAVPPLISSCTRLAPCRPVNVRTSCERRANRLRVSPPDANLRWEANPPYSGFSKCFANGVGPEKASVLAAEQRPAALAQFSVPSGRPAWKTIPSWSLIGTLDHVIPPALQEEMSRRAGAHISRVKAGHLTPITRPTDVTKVILAHRATRARQEGRLAARCGFFEGARRPRRGCECETAAVERLVLTARLRPGAHERAPELAGEVSPWQPLFDRPLHRAREVYHSYDYAS
jgi:hypothetical protein